MKKNHADLFRKGQIDKMNCYIKWYGEPDEETFCNSELGLYWDNFGWCWFKIFDKRWWLKDEKTFKRYLRKDYTNDNV